MDHRACILAILWAILSYSGDCSLPANCMYSLNDLKVTKRSLDTDTSASLDSSYLKNCDTLINGVRYPLIQQYGTIAAFAQDSFISQNGFPDTSQARLYYSMDSASGRISVLSEQNELEPSPLIFRNDSLIYCCYLIELIGTSVGHQFYMPIYDFWDDTVSFDWKYDSLVNQFENSVDIIALTHFHGAYVWECSFVLHRDHSEGRSGRERTSPCLFAITSWERLSAENSAAFDVRGRAVPDRNRKVWRVCLTIPAF